MFICRYISAEVDNVLVLAINTHIQTCCPISPGTVWTPGEAAWPRKQVCAVRVPHSLIRCALCITIPDSALPLLQTGIAEVEMEEDSAAEGSQGEEEEDHAATAAKHNSSK